MSISCRWRRHVRSHLGLWNRPLYKGAFLVLWAGLTGGWEGPGTWGPQHLGRDLGLTGEGGRPLSDCHGLTSFGVRGDGCSWEPSTWGYVKVKPAPGGSWRKEDTSSCHFWLVWWKPPWWQHTRSHGTKMHQGVWPWASLQVYVASAPWVYSKCICAVPFSLWHTVSLWLTRGCPRPQIHKVRAGEGRGSVPDDRPYSSEPQVRGEMQLPPSVACRGGGLVAFYTRRWQAEACGPAPASCLFLYDLRAQNDFYFWKQLEKNKRRIFWHMNIMWNYSVYRYSFIGTQLASFAYMLWCFCATTAEMKVMTEMMWPAKPKIFTLWLFREKKLVDSWSIVLFWGITREINYMGYFNCLL